MADVKQENGVQILLIAGEPSGDLHGAALLHALHDLLPKMHAFGIGGPKMRELGMEQLYTTREMAIMGFAEVVRHLPFIHRVLREIEAAAKSRRPALAILIDYPGFNLRLAARLRRSGIPVLYYIAPQVWAWGQKRAAKMAGMIDHLAVVFSFEEPLFNRYGLPTTFVGHPLLEGLKPELTSHAFHKQIAAESGTPILGLLPGSRGKEIQALFPDMLTTAALLKKKLPALKIVVAQAPNQPRKMYANHINSNTVQDVTFIEYATYSLMAYSTACLVASGTATLETACFGTPLVIVYRTSWLTYQIAKRLVKLNHIGLVNIVAGKAVAPELIQNAFTPQSAARALEPLLMQTKTRALMCKALWDIRSRLGTPGASRRVAALALKMIESSKK